MNGTTHQRNSRGGNLPPATFRIQPVWLNGTTKCSGDDSSPCNVSNRTRGDKTVPPPPTCHSERARSESRNLPEWQVLSCGGSLSNVVDSSTPLRSGRNDKMGGVSTDSPTVSTAFHVAPRPSSGSPSGEPASPEGSSCTVLLGGTIQPHRLYSKRGLAMNHRRYIAWFHSTARVVSGRFPERHTGRSLRFR